MMPPITPPMAPPAPGTPPTTPAIEETGGGASSSLIIWTFSGILVGVRSCPLMMSVWICFTTLTGAAAGGGGGGGGGGGATRKVMSCVFGKASVNNSGSNTSTPISATWKQNEMIVVMPRLVFNLLPDSMRLSSNIEDSPGTTLRILRHRLSPVCSQTRLASYTAIQQSQSIENRPRFLCLRKGSLILPPSPSLRGLGG